MSNCVTMKHRSIHKLILLSLSKLYTFSDQADYTATGTDLLFNFVSGLTVFFSDFGVPVIAHATFDGAQLDLRKVPVTLCVASLLRDSMLLCFLTKSMLSHCCCKGKLIPLKDIIWQWMCYQLQPKHYWFFSRGCPDSDPDPVMDKVLSEALPPPYQFILQHTLTQAITDQHYSSLATCPQQLAKHSNQQRVNYAIRMAAQDTARSVRVSVNHVTIGCTDTTPLKQTHTGQT